MLINIQLITIIGSDCYWMLLHSNDSCGYRGGPMSCCSHPELPAAEMETANWDWNGDGNGPIRVHRAIPNSAMATAAGGGQLSSQCGSSEERKYWALISWLYAHSTCYLCFRLPKIYIYIFLVDFIRILTIQVNQVCITATSCWAKIGLNLKVNAGQQALLKAKKTCRKKPQIIQFQITFFCLNWLIIIGIWAQMHT